MALEINNPAAEVHTPILSLRETHARRFEDCLSYSRLFSSRSLSLSLSLGSFSLSRIGLRKRLVKAVWGEGADPGQAGLGKDAGRPRVHPSVPVPSQGPQYSLLPSSLPSSLSPSLSPSLASLKRVSWSTCSDESGVCVLMIVLMNC